MLSGAEKNECLGALLRGARRYHIASLQDKNPIIAARHNGYAVALIDAARDLATEEEVQRIAGVSLNKLRGDILNMQDKIEGMAFKIYADLVKKGVKIPGMGLGTAIKM